MYGWLRLWRPVVGRVRNDWSFLLAVWLLVVSATSLVAAASLYSDTVEVGGLRRALNEAAAPDRGVIVRTTGSRAEAVSLGPQMRTALDGAFGEAGADVSLTARSPALLPIGSSSEPAARRLVVLGGYDGLADHATLVTGHWPEPGHQPFEAVVSEGAAKALGVGIGARLTFADASVAGADPNAVVASVEIVGTWRPLAADPFWLGDGLDLSGVEDNGSTLIRGPVMVAPEDLLAGPPSGQLQLIWRALPHVDRLRVDGLAAIRAGIAGLPGNVARILPPSRFVTVSTSIGDVLGTIDRAGLVSRSGVVVMTLQFGILAGYALLLVGGLLVERRRTEVGLLRARGASTVQVAALAFGEATLLAVPAVVAAPFVAVALVDLLGRWGAVGESGIIAAVAISWATVVAAILAGLACILALAVPALVADLDLARVRAALGRPLAATAAQRLGLDVVLLVLAAVGLIQLRTYGAPLTRTTGGDLGVDPLLVAAPAIGMAAGAVLVVRYLPRLSAIAEWLLRRRPGLVLALGARQLARRPLRYTRAALLIVLAGALGTFAAAYSATWSRSQADQAQYQAGADLRVVLGSDSTTDTTTREASLRAISGVAAVGQVEHDQVDVGRVLRSADLVAVEAEAVAPMIAAPADQTGGDTAAGLQALAAQRPVLTSGLELPGRPQRIGVVLDASLGAFPGDPAFREPWPGIQVIPTVQFGDGSVVILSEAPALFQGQAQRVEFPLVAGAGLPPSAAHYPVRLLSIEIDLQPPGLAVGDVTLRRIDTSPSAAGNDWVAAADVAGLTDWSFSEPRGSPPGSLNGPSIGFDQERPLFGFFDEVPSFTWAPPPAEAPTIAAIASTRFLAAAGVKVGDTLQMDLHFQKVSAHIIGSVDAFPSLDAQKPFVIVDAATLDATRQLLGQATVPPREWWLRLDGGAEDQVTATLRAAPFSAQQIVSRAELTRSLESDPVALGLVGALALGSLAAAVFAAVGFLVTAVVAGREQVGAVALLRALGLSRRQVLAWLAMDQAYLLVIGLVAGVGLGWLIAGLVLPFAILDRAGLPVVPSPVILVPWELLAALGGLAAVVLVVTVVAASRAVASQPIADVLRAQEI
ncbi:MAG: FtsX-like permease family protein [Candidatus Limnocylindrales bacterium]